MKKSTMFRVAQFAVLNSDNICANDKLEVLRLLMDNEDVAKYVEDREEQEKANETV